MKINGGEALSVKTNKIPILETREHIKAFGIFLEAKVDHERIWKIFDPEYEGAVPVYEFLNLLNACLAMHIHEIQQEHLEVIDSKVVDENTLDPKVKELWQKIKHKFEVSTHDSIYFTEFQRAGRYIIDFTADIPQPVDKKKTKKQTDWEKHLFEEVEQVVKTEKRGSTVWHGGQLVHYDASKLASILAFGFFYGTAFNSFYLWLKISLLCFVTLIGFIFAKLCMDVGDVNIEELAEFTEGLEVLLALILAFYVGNMTSRWWVIRREGIGGIIKAVSDIVLLVGAIAHGDSASERAIRNDVIRYGLLSHALLYYEAQGMMEGRGKDEAWVALEAGEFITRDEVLILRNVKRKFGAIWSWLLAYLQELMKKDLIPKERYSQFTEICRTGRKSANLVLTHLECQLPLPYVHLVCFITNVYQFTIAFTSGIVAAAAWEQEEEQIVATQIVFWQFFRGFVFCLIYQSLLETIEQISNPLGTDDIDFPGMYIHLSCKYECESMFAAVNKQPWSKRRLPEVRNRRSSRHSVHEIRRAPSRYLQRPSVRLPDRKDSKLMFLLDQHELYFE